MMPNTYRWVLQWPLISDVAYTLLQEKYKYVFEALESSNHVRAEKIKNEFVSYCCELIILGFNSGSYDLNLIKSTLIIHLLDKLDFVIKRANNYLCIKNKKLRFLDIKNFLAPGFSYKKFLTLTMAVMKNFFSHTSLLPI